MDPVFPLAVSQGLSQHLETTEFLAIFENASTVYFLSGHEEHISLTVSSWKILSASKSSLPG